MSNVERPLSFAANGCYWPLAAAQAPGMGMKYQVFCVNLDELWPLCNMAL